MVEHTFPPKLKSSLNVTFSFSFCLRLTGAVERGGGGERERGGGRELKEVEHSEGCKEGNALILPHTDNRIIACLYVCVLQLKVDPPGELKEPFPLGCPHSYLQQEIAIDKLCYHNFGNNRYSI